MVPLNALESFSIYNVLTKSWPLFITRTARTGEYFNRGKVMTDLIYILVVVLFFVISGVYVRFCEKL